MLLEDQLRAVDRLLALSFPTEDTRDGWHSSGPAHHVRALRVSQDFWDDGLEVVKAVWEEMDAARGELAALLTARWGRPEEIELWYGEETAEPMIDLSRMCGRLSVWRPPHGSRWVGLATGQEDREFPILLLAAIGEQPTPHSTSQD
ncbi:hypothetical protein [Nonomuraea sediminis]|uniref:hypothetical protein n=1 Tax=Nonomuraea sediminis TaxID=2835864 RepID=UPI001BDD6A44|nr:hypothetical protein [Nonomuraea sediminis]